MEAKSRDEQLRTSISYLKLAADKGHLDAITDLGYSYEKGVYSSTTNSFILEPELNKAEELYKNAAD